MAKYSSTTFVLLFLSVSLNLSLFFVPASSTSRVLTKRPSFNTKVDGFRVQLSHVTDGLAGHNSNLTKLQRLARRITRGRARLHRLSSASTRSADVATPVRAGNGEFLMKLSIGTPAKEFSAIMDTGSDLIWTQCLPCSNCFDQKTPIFDPKESSSFTRVSCSSQLCTALPSSSSSCGGGGDQCDYFYSYGDSSSTEGVLATETLTLGGVSVGGVGFGCGSDNEGDGFGQAAGLVGLGRGPLSLVSQLNQRRFSYCLTSMDEDEAESSLLMGSLAGVTRQNDTSFGEVKTTGLVRNPSLPTFYYLDLQGISIGDKRLPLKKDAFAVRDNGSGGLIIDSGTTITYLEHKAFDVLKDEFVNQMSSLEVDDSGSQGLDLCFSLPKGVTTIEIPKLVFHFRGADLELPAENYILSDSELGLVCLAMGASSGLSIFGNFQQQNMLVVHDLEKETLSFVPTQCDKL